MSRSIVVLSAPSNLGLMPPAPGEEPGVNRMPVALKTLGLIDDLDAEDRGTVPPLSYSGDIDPGTGVRNTASIRSYTIRLAASVHELVSNDSFLLVLGGDCSILLGTMLGLRKRGNYGLVFIDGHCDFQTPESSETKGAAGMDLAFVTGHGPETLTRFDNRSAIVSEENVVAIGFQEETMPGAVLDIERSEIRRVSLAEFRSEGAERAIRATLDRMTRQQVNGYWIHLDVDVLDAAIMPAVDSPNPGGMTYDELASLILPLLMDPRAVGMELTIYDPERDPTGTVGQVLSDWLVDVFAQAGLLKR